MISPDETEQVAWFTVSDLGLHTPLCYRRQCNNEADYHENT